MRPLRVSNSLSLFFATERLVPPRHLIYAASAFYNRLLASSICPRRRARSAATPYVRIPSPLALSS